MNTNENNKVIILSTYCVDENFRGLLENYAIKGFKIKTSSTLGKTLHVILEKD